MNSYYILKVGEMYFKSGGQMKTVSSWLTFDASDKEAHKFETLEEAYGVLDYVNATLHGESIIVAIKVTKHEMPTLPK